jgi:hypothetical protein
MAAVNPTSREIANRRGKAIAIELCNENEDVRQTSRTRNAMILLAIVMLGTAVATHAFAAGRMGGGFGLDSGFRGGHMSHGFQPPILDEAPTRPVPTFNPSDPYTVPQSPETPVSPASPESVFGNG